MHGIGSPDLLGGVVSVQLRQVCLVARELGPVIEDLTAILGVKVCHVDPGVARFGVENALLGVGKNFLEVVAPLREQTAAGRYLDRRNGDGGYMVITQADTLANQQAIRQRALDREIRIAFEREHRGGRLCQLHPGDLIAAFLEVDYEPQEDFEGNWTAAGGIGWKDAVRQDVTLDFLGVELQAPDPGALAALWGGVIGAAVSQHGSEAQLTLNNAYLRFVQATDGRGAGLSGLEVAVKDRGHILAEAERRDCLVSEDQVELCGTTFHLQDA